jgi:hypothetical protein
MDPATFPVVTFLSRAGWKGSRRSQALRARAQRSSEGLTEMSDTPASEPLPVRIGNSFKQLHASAVQLQNATNDFVKVTAPLDELLQKLNLGVECWVRVNKWSFDHGVERYHDLGYSKVGSDWGVAIRAIDTNDCGEQLSHDVWLFNEAPRTMRIDAIGKVPDLLDELTKKAEKFTRKVRESTDTARDVVNALQDAAVAAGVVKPAKVAAR